MILLAILLGVLACVGVAMVVAEAWYSEIHRGGWNVEGDDGHE